MSQPTKGGQYTRDPETGELTKVEAIAAPAAAPVSEPSNETPAPAEKPASAKRGRNV